MIHFLFGKPRAGKSLLAVRLLVDEIKGGKRLVVTNLPLDLGKLAEYCGGDLAGRVRILKDDECSTFWRFSGPDRECKRWDSFRQGDLALRVPTFSDREHPVLYVIDEAHLFFNAREWQKVGMEAAYYMSQHGKLGDEIVLVSQHPQQVDKGFRMLGQDFTVVKNLANEAVMGFGAPGWFRWASFGELPRQGSVQSASGTFKLDVSGVAALYNSSAGAGGIVGRGVSEESHSRARSWKWLLLFPVFVAVVAWWGPKWFGSVMSGVSRRFLGGASAVASSVATNGQVGLAPAGFVSPASAGVQSPGVGGEVVSYQLMGAASWWRLSDGRLITMTTPGFERGGELGVFVDGRYYPSK